MKAFQLAVILLIFSGAVALRCNRCVPSRVGGSCHNTVETCQMFNAVCAVVTFPYPNQHTFKRCMKSADASILRANPHAHVSTCTTDLCN